MGSGSTSGVDVWETYRDGPGVPPAYPSSTLRPHGVRREPLHSPRGTDLGVELSWRREKRDRKTGDHSDAHLTLYIYIYIFRYKSPRTDGVRGTG